MVFERAGGSYEKMYPLESHVNHILTHVNECCTDGYHAAFQGLIDIMYMQFDTGCQIEIADVLVKKFLDVTNKDAKVVRLGEFVLGKNNYHELDRITQFIIEDTIERPKEYSHAFCEFLGSRRGLKKT